MASEISGVIDVVLKRRGILEYICQHEPDKRTLESNLSQSRPTIDRAIRQLEDHNLVERTNGVCEPTYTGKIACDLCSDFRDVFEILESAGDEIASLPTDAELDTSVFFDGVLFHPPDYAPYERIEPLYDDIRDAEEIVAVSEVIVPHIDQILEYGLDENVDMSLFVNDGAMDILLEKQPNKVIPHIESGDSIYKGIEISQYSLFLIDDEVLYTGIFSPTNHLSTIIRNKNHQAIQWATQFISHLQDEGTLLTA